MFIDLPNLPNMTVGTECSSWNLKVARQGLIPYQWIAGSDLQAVLLQWMCRAMEDYSAGDGMLTLNQIALLRARLESLSTDSAVLSRRHADALQTIQRIILRTAELQDQQSKSIQQMAALELEISDLQEVERAGQGIDRETQVRCPRVKYPNLGLLPHHTTCMQDAHIASILRACLARLP